MICTRNFQSSRAGLIDSDSYKARVMVPRRPRIRRPRVALIYFEGGLGNE